MTRMIFDLTLSTNARQRRRKWKFGNSWRDRGWKSKRGELGREAKMENGEKKWKGIRLLKGYNWMVPRWRSAMRIKTGWLPTPPARSTQRAIAPPWPLPQPPSYKQLSSSSCERPFIQPLFSYIYILLDFSFIISLPFKSWLTIAPFSESRISYQWKSVEEMMILLLLSSRHDLTGY